MFNKTQTGNAAGDIALTYLQAKGLRLIDRQFKTPGRGGGEIDLIMQEQSPHTLNEPTLVFVEVRHRATVQHGSGADSVGGIKQGRIIYAARHYLARITQRGAALPACRFDVVSITGDMFGKESAPPQIDWLPAAFGA